MVMNSSCLTHYAILLIADDNLVELCDLSLHIFEINFGRNVYLLNKCWPWYSVLHDYEGISPKTAAVHRLKYNILKYVYMYMSY